MSLCGRAYVCVCVPDLTRFEETGLRVYKNLKRFCEKKVRAPLLLPSSFPCGVSMYVRVSLCVHVRRSPVQKPAEQVFDLINTTQLNKELTSMMPGLSAKVFRTYNASIVLEKELANLSEGTPIADKVLEYNRANREVAILCNHQRTVPKGFQEQFDKMQSKVGACVAVWVCARARVPSAPAPFIPSPVCVHVRCLL